MLVSTAAILGQNYLRGLLVLGKRLPMNRPVVPEVSRGRKLKEYETTYHVSICRVALPNGSSALAMAN